MSSRHSSPMSVCCTIRVRDDNLQERVSEVAEYQKSLERLKSFDYIDRPCDRDDVSAGLKNANMYFVLYIHSFTYDQPSASSVPPGNKY